MKLDGQLELIRPINDHVSNELSDGMLEQYLIQLHQLLHERPPLTQIFNTNKNRQAIKEVDQELGKLIRQLLENSSENALEVVDQPIYSAAYVAAQKCGIKIRVRQKSNVYKRSAWIERINREVIQLRADILSFLKQAKRKLINAIRIIAKHDLYKKTKDTQIEILKQKLQLKTKRLVLILPVIAFSLSVLVPSFGTIIHCM
ncbi:Hypothetical predicted protein [Octopus vulgaris]|uniref:Uncharacterized protein n=1 Tax=Octopus vulgaris TaxID=6645 RepID=A0AA36AYI5_OCTVU|nr:Hypothetical predicted protein [Octopus vulgaris]